MNNLSAPAIKVCDNKSVGVFVFGVEDLRYQRGARLLLIERATFPWGWAVPSGHLDGEVCWPEQAHQELLEEVGLDIPREQISLGLILRAKKSNQCRRFGGDWHEWRLYATYSNKLDEIVVNPREVKNFCWASCNRLEFLAERARQWLEGEISDEEWKESPGLEPLTLDWLSLKGLEPFLQSLR